MLVHLNPREREYDYDIIHLAFPSFLNSLKQPGRIKHAVKQLIRTYMAHSGTMRSHCRSEEAQVDDLMKVIKVSINSAPSLAQLLSNRVDIARHTEAMHARFDDTWRCACRNGPFAEYLDVNVGHVLTTDMHILKPILGEYAKSHVGLNLRIPKTLPRGDKVPTAVLELHEAMLDATGRIAKDLGLDEAQVLSELNMQQCTRTLKILVRQAYELWCRWGVHKQHIRLQRGHEEYIQLMHSHLLITCMDKAPSACVVVCMALGRWLIASRLLKGSYTMHTDREDTVHDLASRVRDMMSHIGVSPSIRTNIPYMYPILKVHKCPDHDPWVVHTCKYEWRFIQSACDGFATGLAELNASMLQATFRRIDKLRLAESEDFYAKHGYRLRFRFGISSWQTVALSLPQRVPEGYSIHVGDIQDAFPSLPLSGEDSVYLLVERHTREAFGDMPYLAIPLDENDCVKGKAKFAMSERISSLSYGPVVRHLVLTEEQVVACIHMSLQVDVVGSHTMVASPTRGVPIGGNASSLLLDVCCDQWEVGCSRRVVQLADSTERDDRRLARRIAALLRWYFRYADDMITLAEVEFPSLLWNHNMPGQDRESPLWIYPLRNSEGEPELGIKLSPSTTDANGITSEDFLCLSISLAPASDGYRRLSFAPYNKRHEFKFVFPMLTMWISATRPCIKRAVLKSMSQYAVLGSTQITGSTRFMKFVVDRLFINGYLRPCIKAMWLEIIRERYLYSIPCRWCLHERLHDLELIISDYIARHD